MVAELTRYVPDHPDETQPNSADLSYISSPVVHYETMSRSLPLFTSESTPLRARCMSATWPR